MNSLLRRFSEDGTTCSEANLTKLIEDNKVPFDADIAGLGVLFGFLTTSIFALITTIAAYSTFPIPTELLNESDEVLMKMFRTPFICIWKRSCLPDYSRTKSTDHQKDRINTFTAFMQSTSDQILVSELAILIAALAGHKEITIYSLDIVIALACLASTVHLATFPLLVKDLKDHTLAKLVRVVIMCSAAAMLVFWLFWQLSEDWNYTTRVYFHCLGWKWRLTALGIPNFLLSVLVPLTVLTGTFNVVRLLYGRNENDPKSKDWLVDSGEDKTPQPAPNGNSWSGRHDNHGDQAVQRPAEPEDTHIGHDIQESTVRRRNTLSHRRPPPSNGEEDVELDDLDLEQGLPRVPIERRIVTDPGSREQHGPENQSNLPRPPKRTLTDNLKSIPSVWNAEKSRLMRLWLKDVAMKAKNEKYPIKRQTWLALRHSEAWAFHQCQNSFMWRILWLWSGNIYGVTRVFMARSNTEGLSGDRDKFGFGQIVPLALLLLPIFAAMQARNEYVKATSDYKADTPEGDIQKSPTKPVHVEFDHPDIASWAQGTNPTCSLAVKVCVRGHAFVMFAFVTVLGFFTAYGADIVFTSIIFAIPILVQIRSAIFTHWLKRKYLKDKKTVQESSQNNPQDQSSNMMTAEAAGSMAPEEER